MRRSPSSLWFCASQHMWKCMVVPWPSVEGQLHIPPRTRQQHLLHTPIAVRVMKNLMYNEKKKKAKGHISILVSPVDFRIRKHYHWLYRCQEELVYDIMPGAPYAQHWITQMSVHHLSPARNSTVGLLSDSREPLHRNMAITDVRIWKNWEILFRKGSANYF